MRVLVQVGLVLMLLVATMNLASAIDMDKCITMTESGVYKLTKDIFNSKISGCMTIAASNITLDCRGKLIDSDLTAEYGILVKDVSDITIQNCYVQDWKTAGMKASNVQNLVIRDIGSYHNNGIGVLLQNVGLNIEDAVINSNSQEGMLLENSDKAIISIFTANNEGWGLKLNNVTQSEIVNTSVLNNKNGIRIESSSGNTIHDSLVKNTRGTAIWIELSSNNLLESNKIVGSQSVALIITNSAKNFLYNNWFYNGNNINELKDGQIQRWNIFKSKGENIAGGPFLGGNYWGQPDGQGFSQKCIDLKRDGLCDSGLGLGGDNVDYLPLSNKFPQSVRWEQYY